MPELSSPHPPYVFTHRNDIQSLRGVAVILVVLYHAQELITGGYVGVDVFFVISGFVIAAGILRELDRRDGKFSFRSFYERRMRRLLPSLSITVLLTLVAGLFLSPYSSLKFLRRTGLAATFFNANHYLYRNVDYSAPSAERNALLHTWSLSVEEQFYFIFPVLFVLAAAVAMRGRRRLYHTVGMLMGAVFATSFLAELYFSYTSTSWFGLDMKRSAFFFAPLRAWEFGIGVLLAVALPWMQRISHVWVGRALSLMGAVLVIASALLYTEGMLFPGMLALLPALGTAMVIASGSLASSVKGTTLLHRTLTKIGDLSYGWYLWHWPLLVFVQASWPGEDPFWAMVGSLVVSLAMAKLNELAIERPIRHAAWVKTTRANLLILTACFALPIVGFMLQRIMVPRFQQHHTVKQIDVLEKEYEAIGCQNTPYSADQSACRWGEQGAAWRVVLIGDSNARQFIPALQEVVPALGGEFHASTMSSCFVTDLRSMRMSTEYDLCTTWLDATLKELLAHPPDVILISSAYDHYLSSHAWSLSERDLSHTYQHDEVLAATQKSIMRLSRQLTDTGARVGFIKPIPKFRSHQAFLARAEDTSISIGSDCSLLKLMVYPSSCNASRPLRENGELEWISPEYGREAYRTALADHTFEVVVDQDICPDNRCEAMRDGRWIYRDTQHISPYGALRTSSTFEQTLRAIKNKEPHKPTDL